MTRTSFAHIFIFLTAICFAPTSGANTLTIEGSFWSVSGPNGDYQGITSFSGSFAGVFDENLFNAFVPLTLPISLTAIDLSPSVFGSTTFDLSNVSAEIFYPGLNATPGSPISIALFGSINGSSMSSNTDDFYVAITDLDEAVVTPTVSIGSFPSTIETLLGDGSFTIVIPEPASTWLLVFGAPLLLRRCRV